MLRIFFSFMQFRTFQMQTAFQNIYKFDLLLFKYSKFSLKEIFLWEIKIALCMSNIETCPGDISRQKIFQILQLIYNFMLIPLKVINMMQKFVHFKNCLIVITVHFLNYISFYTVVKLFKLSILVLKFKYSAVANIFLSCFSHRVKRFSLGNI